MFRTNILFACGMFSLGLHAHAECQSTENAPISNPNGYSVYLVEKVCDGIAASEEGRIEISFNEGKRTTILKYDSAFSFVRDGAEATPVIGWQDSKTLKISIGKIATLDTELQKYDDITIIYHIGAIVFK